MTWTRYEAIALCRDIEAICPEYGCHVALTGGLLYKDGARKDADILFYRIRSVAEIEFVGLFKALRVIGIETVRFCGWVVKATWNDKPIDFFFPETQSAQPYGDTLETEVLKMAQVQFNGVKVFSETKMADRNMMGDRITSWLRDNPDITVVDKVVTQSSDEAFHCLSITLFIQRGA